MAKEEKVSKNAENLNKILVENFVNLQKATTNLAVKFDSLSGNISKLLQLFEISAKSFADKLAAGMPEVEKDTEFLDKLNKLLEQNKVIARGLTLMEEKIRERIYGHAPQTARQPPSFMPPKFQPPFMPSPSSEGYTPSSLEEKRTKPLEE